MWHYVLNGKSVGPVSEEEIRSLLSKGTLSGSSLVWTEGMPEWQEARVAGLCDTGPEAPPSMTPPPLPPQPAPVPMPQTQPADETSLSVLAHVLGLVTGFLGPLIILLVAQQPGTKAHARRALNWQISLMIYVIAAIPLCFIVIGIFLILAAGILDLVFSILAAVKAGNREIWSYPITIPFLKD